MPSLDDVVKNRAATVALARKVAGLPDDDPTPEATFEEAVSHRALSPSLEIAPAKFAWLRDLLAQDGKLPADYDAGRLIDTSIRAGALARLGR